MPTCIGVLLPRSLEYPSIGFDLLDGLRIHLRQMGHNDITFQTENIGFGEDPEINHGAAEKLVINHDVDLLVVYATSLNAEPLYSFAASSGKPILFLDAGMEHFEAPVSPLCYHLTLQGTLGCSVMGSIAAKQAKKIAFETSFLDGGYRGGGFSSEALNKDGSEVTRHYVSLFKSEEFSLTNLENLIQQTETDAVFASFSSYLAGLFLTHLKNASDKLKNTPFYCSPFLPEEMQLDPIPFPGAVLNTLVPWARAIESMENQVFIDTIKKEKNKPANIFHLLGWEAAMVVEHMISKGAASLPDASFNTPRGIMRFHPETHNAYAPLYEGRIAEGENNTC